MELNVIRQADPQVADAIEAELNRQRSHIELIASENFVSPAVMAAMGSCLTNKYAEGYPAHRYYGGCECVDVVENLARDRAKQLFGCEYVNVQPHSGAQANTAVYFAMLQPGDTVMGMSLSNGGHLTHGSPVNLSGKYFHFVPYGVDAQGYIDYDAMRALALECKPKMIVSGASAYPRTIDFEKIRAICDEVGALMMVDIAHIAGLVAAGQHPSPVPYADFVTTTTHKTLRGPRGGMIMCREQYGNHLLLLDFSGTEMTGKLLETLLEEANITVNKNTVPNETRSPFVTSGVRVGTPAVTSRGFKEADMAKVAKWIARVVREGENAVPSVKAEVEAFMKNFPLYE